jgi:hypothetical protein
MMMIKVMKQTRVTSGFIIQIITYNIKNKGKLS